MLRQEWSGRSNDRCDPHKCRYLTGGESFSAPAHIGRFSKRKPRAPTARARVPFSSIIEALRTVSSQRSRFLPRRGCSWRSLRFRSLEGAKFGLRRSDRRLPAAAEPIGAASPRRAKAKSDLTGSRRREQLGSGCVIRWFKGKLREEARAFAASSPLWPRLGSNRKMLHQNRLGRDLAQPGLEGAASEPRDDPRPARGHGAF